MTINRFMSVSWQGEASDNVSPFCSSFWKIIYKNFSETSFHQLSPSVLGLTVTLHALPFGSPSMEPCWCEASSFLAHQPLLSPHQVPPGWILRDPLPFPAVPFTCLSINCFL